MEITFKIIHIIFFCVFLIGVYALALIKIYWLGFDHGMKELGKYLTSKFEKT